MLLRLNTTAASESHKRHHLKLVGHQRKMGPGKVAAITAAGAVGGVVLAPVVLGAVGFTSAGIAAGSYAAGMMSSAAVANGGGVVAGSLVAVLQSAGAAGLPTAATAVVAGIGGGVGAAASWLTSLLR